MKCHAVIEGSPASTAKRATETMRASRAGMIQTKLSVGGADDAYEHEAERAADTVTRGSHSQSQSNGGLAAGLTPLVQRTPANKQRKEPDDDHKTQVAQRAPAHEHRKDPEDDHKKIQKRASGPSHTGALEGKGVPEKVENQIIAMSASGERLAPADRAFYEKHFGHSFSDVRVHSGPEAQQASAAINARAFTVGQHIFFGAGEHRPQTVQGRHLMAHELAHTVQQSTPATRAARSIQRGLFDRGKAWVLGKIREYAAVLPGYRLLSVVIGHDPITDEEVDRSPENLIHGVLDFVPDGEEIFQNLQANKQIQQFVDYFEGQVKVLNLTWDSIKALFQQAWDQLGIDDALDPGGAWDKLKVIFGPPLTRLKDFAKNVAGYIIDAIKKKVLAWLRDWAAKMRGYSLLTFILGKDPFTDEPVERTPATFVKAVLALVDGGDKIYENLQKSRTIERTVEWLNQEIQKLDLSWEKIKQLFLKAWNLISTADLLNPLDFVGKIRDIFEPPAVRVVSFALAVGKKVLEFIFEGVMLLAGATGQRIVAIFRKASAAFSTIVADPAAFLGHLIDSVVLGFKQFTAKIGQYLMEGVVAWLVGALEGGGLVLPKVWDLKGILSLALQVMGITYAKIRAKIVKALGPNGEKIVSTAERVWSFLVALVTEGPAAAWQKITETLGNFWDMVIGAIKNWAITKIIKTAVVQLLAMFNPVGAVVEAIIEIYRTVSFFVNRINQILALVEAITDSIASIAAGKIAAAANFVEKTLGRTIPVIIGFLASLIGLDDVSEGIRKAIDSFQKMVDAAIDKAIEWIVTQVKKLFGKKDEDKPHDEKWDAAVAGVKQELGSLGKDETRQEKIKEKLPEWKQKYGFSSLRVAVVDEKFEIFGAMSDEKLVAADESGLHTGNSATEKEAIPIYWYKAPDKYEEAIELTVAGQKPQIPMFGQTQVKDMRRNHLGEDLMLGVKGEKQVKKGTFLERTKSQRTGEQGKFRSVLNALGYDWSGKDADHVKDLAFDGNDAFENLWPLDSVTNRIGLRFYSQYRVEFIDTNKGEERVTNLMNLDGKHFKVIGFTDDVPTKVGGRSDSQP